MKKRFELPYAENFAKYLEDILEGELTADGPESMGDRSYDMDYVKRWIIRQNEKKIGEYRTFGPKPGETNFAREFSGVIEGYVSEDTKMINKWAKKDLKRPVKICLSFNNWRTITTKDDPNYDCEFDYPTPIVKTPWQRQDGHTLIPFP